MGDLPWLETTCLDKAVFEQVRLRTIFDCCKWDPQIGDVSILADFPLMLKAEIWRQLADLAERLSAELMAAERELVSKPELHGKLGLSRAITRLWKRPPEEIPNCVRLIRYDFHYTTDGWKISEANADTPGGWIESSGFAALMAEQFPGKVIAGSPVKRIAEAIHQAVGGTVGAKVALVHPTSYSDDHQLTVFLGKHLEALGVSPALVSPAHIRWQDGQAFLAADWDQGKVDFLVRYFPAEWLPNMPRNSGWQMFFVGGKTPVCNPGTAALIQSKRFPLVWDKLQTPMPTWRNLLPETRHPRDIDLRRLDDWVIKPAFGRFGDEIVMTGITPEKDLRKIRRNARWFPGDWIAQRRFEAVAMPTPYGPGYPCIGVYTVNGRAVGAYGRLGKKPLIDMLAQDVAVLLDGPGEKS
jgi:glutathionylspermidine synthase